MTGVYLSHKHGPGCEHKHIGWGDAFSGAIKRPCASAYKLSAKSDSTGTLGGEEAEWINPPLCVRAVWLLQQPRLLGLLKLIYKASVYSGFPRQGKVNSNGALDGNKSQHGYKAHTAFFLASKLKIPPPNNPNFMYTPTHSSITPLNQATQERSKLALRLATSFRAVSSTPPPLLSMLHLFMYVGVNTHLIH